MIKLFFLFFLPASLLSQGISNIWITGYDNWAGAPWGNTVINFNSGVPVLSAQNMSLSFLRTNSSIADTLGNLLFYTNGFAVCNAFADTIYQYDMLASNIASSRQTVAVWDSFYSPSPPFAITFYTEQLAPDGKIYITTGNGTDKLHVINYPDSAGLACDVCQHCITLPSYNAFGCIPNHPNYFLGAEIGSGCDTITVVTENNYPPGNTSIKIYPNPASGFFWLDYNLTNSPGNGELFIYNTLGGIVQHKTLYNYFKTAKVECGNLPQGIYYLAIKQNNKKVSSGKFVKE